MAIFNCIFDWIFKYFLKVSVQVFVAASILACKQPKRKFFLLRYLPVALTYYFIFIIIPGDNWWLNIMSQHIGAIKIIHFYTFAYIITIIVIWFCFNIKLQSAIFYSTCAYLIQHLSSNLGWAVI